MRRLKTPRLLALAFVLLAMGAGPLWGQTSLQPFTLAASAAPEICHKIALPVFTYPAPGGVATTGTSNVILYKLHISNLSGGTVYAQLFNLTASPTASATPIGSASWAIATASDKDITLGEEMGMAFNVGAEVCCSTVQGTYTAAGAGSCGFIMEYR